MMNAAEAMAALLVAIGIPDLPFFVKRLRAPCSLVDRNLLAARRN
jgi:hypothetical protein